MKKRFTSPIVWLSVIAQVCIIIGLFKPEISDTVKVIGASVIEILTLFGILNNPKDKEAF